MSNGPESEQCCLQGNPYGGRGAEGKTFNFYFHRGDIIIRMMGSQTL